MKIIRLLINVPVIGFVIFIFLCLFNKKVPKISKSPLWAAYQGLAFGIFSVSALLSHNIFMIIILIFVDCLLIFTAVYFITKYLRNEKK